MKTHLYGEKILLVYITSVDKSKSYIFNNFLGKKDTNHLIEKLKNIDKIKNKGNSLPRNGAEFSLEEFQKQNFLIISPWIGQKLFPFMKNFIRKTKMEIG